MHKPPNEGKACFFIHWFKNGLMLAITVAPTKGGANFYHQWLGTGCAEISEMRALVRHYRSSIFQEVADYLEFAI